MNVLVLGSGGREHCLAWSLTKSVSVKKVFVHPGNAGIFEDKNIHALENAQSLEDILVRAKANSISLIVIGPENLLEEGYADFFRSKGFDVVGPNKEAAVLESSKSYAKSFMQKYSITTASYAVAHSFFEACKIIQASKHLLVLKADELAQGKGVVVAESELDALEAARNFMANPEYLVQSKKLVIEQRLNGPEISAIALVDGKNYKILGYAQDHKRALDNDEGPNTGGMGVAMYKHWPEASIKEQITKMFDQTLHGLAQEKLMFQGFLFLGVLVEKGKAHLLEYNVRSGDPETQVIFPYLINQHKVDVGALFLNVAKGNLEKLSSHFENKQDYIHVVLASGNYPDMEGKGMKLAQEIKGVPAMMKEENCYLFYSGVKKNAQGQLINSGGRILGVTAGADGVSAAREKAYKIIQGIEIKDAFYRRDIGASEGRDVTGK